MKTTMTTNEIKTNERLGILENEVKNLKETNKTEHKELKRLLEEIGHDLKNLDRRFASKWIETFIYALIVILVTALIGGAVALLYK